MYKVLSTYTCPLTVRCLRRRGLCNLLVCGWIRSASEFGKEVGGWCFSCEQNAVVLLFLVDVINVSLNLRKLLFENDAFLCEDLLTLRND